MKPLTMGLYGQKEYLRAIKSGDHSELHRATFIGYDDSYGPIPERRWITDHGLSDRVRVQTSSTRGMLNAVVAGTGLAILPKIFASRHPQLIEVALGSYGAISERGAWIVWHRDVTRRAGIRETIRWIEECFRRADQPSRPSAGNVSSSQ
jgi:DNA-binding transcriptional LysR family regulator